METRLPAWKFTPKELEGLRAAAIDRGKSPLSVEEEKLLVRYYLRRIYQMSYLRGKKAQLAVAYAQRFFINNSVYSVNPRATIAAAIVIACKAMENRLGNIDYIQEFWVTGRSAILEMEPVLLGQLRFDINIQTLHEKFDAIVCKLGPEEARKLLTKEDWDAAYRFMNELTTTDAVLLYSPEEVATAVFRNVVTRKGPEAVAEFEKAFREKVAQISEAIEANLRAIQVIIENEAMAPFPTDRLPEITGKLVRTAQPPTKRVKV